MKFSRWMQARVSVVTLVIASFSVSPVLRAASIERDLGDGLVYYRIHALPADLPADVSVKAKPIVIDIRYAKADASAARVFASWIKFRAGSHAPMYLLVNSTTALPLVSVLGERDGLNVLVIGPAGQKIAPDIPVREAAAEERRAYEALESGTPVAALTTDNPDKPRNDEASLAQTTPQPTTEEVETEEPEEAPSEAKSQPLIDEALQRAIQIYRGLRAMKAA